MEGRPAISNEEAVFSDAVKALQSHFLDALQASEKLPQVKALTAVCPKEAACAQSYAVMYMAGGAMMSALEVTDDAHRIILALLNSWVPDAVNEVRACLDMPPLPEVN